MITRSLSAALIGVSTAGFKMVWQSHKYRIGWLIPVRLGMIAAAVVPPVFLIMAMRKGGKEGSLIQDVSRDEVAVGMSLGIASVALDQAAQLLGATVTGEL